VSIAVSFLLGNLLPTFSEAFSAEFTRICYLAEKRQRFEIPASFI
jgi:hypothetical protein